MKQQKAQVRPNGAASPRILITDTNRTPVVPRLAMRLHKLGSQVGVLCVMPGNPIACLHPRINIFPYRGLHPVAALRTAIQMYGPTLVVPACDRTVQHLHDLYSMELAAGRKDRGIASLIERSLGPPKSFPIVSSRDALLRIAREEGIRVPQFCAICDVAELKHWSKEVQPPWVIKADGTWGGRGVRIVHSFAEGHERLRELTDQAGTLELFKRMFLNRDRDWVYQDWNRPRPSIVAQSFIQGRPANCAVVCHDGKLLAAIAVEVVQTQGATGPATVVQLVEGREMIDAARRIAKRLRLSGFFGLDFVIEDRTGATNLIEMNPRCTPPCALPLGNGRDLVAALWQQLTNQSFSDSPSTISQRRIVYFPQISPRNGGPDPLLVNSYLDIPEGEPALVERMLNPRPLRSVLGQLVDCAKLQLSRDTSPSTVLFESPITAQPAVAAHLDGAAHQLVKTSSL